MALFAVHKLCTAYIIAVYCRKYRPFRRRGSKSISTFHYKTRLPQVPTAIGSEKNMVCPLFQFTSPLCVGYFCSPKDFVSQRNLQYRAPLLSQLTVTTITAKPTHASTASDIVCDLNGSLSVWSSVK